MLVSILIFFTIPKIFTNLVKILSEHKIKSNKSSYYTKSKEKTYLKLKDKFTTIFHSTLLIFKSNSKILILTVSSLMTTFTLLVILPFLKEYLEISSREKRNKVSLIESLIVSTHLSMCKWKTNFLIENYLLVLFSLPLTLFLYLRNSFSYNKQNKLTFDLVVPMNPFSKTNRFITCTIYAAYVHNLSKIFQFSFVYTSRFVSNSTSDSLIENLNEFQSLSSRGILIDLALRILNVLVIGCQFYPILLCVEFKHKSKISYLFCTVYAWFIFAYYVMSNELCVSPSYIKRNLINFSWSIISSYLDNIHLDHFKLSLLNATFNSSGYHQFNYEYNLEEFIFYFILCLIAASLNLEFILLVLAQLAKLNQEFLPVFIRNRAANDYYDRETHIAIKYTLNKLHETKLNKLNAFNRFISLRFYSNVKYFKFSKQFLNINIISFILLFNICCFIVNKSYKLSYILAIITVNILKQLIKNNTLNERHTSDKIAFQINDIIVKSCILTTLIYVFQLLFGIKNYKSNVLKAYRGDYSEIPRVTRYSSAKLTAGSLHYSGYAIGFLLIGYVILFNVNLFIICAVKILIQTPLLQLDLLKYGLPFVSIFLLKRFLIWFLCRFVLTTRSCQLKNFKFYLIVNHFSFFFDCFIILFVSVWRFVYSVLAALFFFPRLDYRLFGLGLERFDMGFMSYVGFLHIEGLILIKFKNF